MFGSLDDLVQAGKIRYYGVALSANPESEETGEGAIDEREVASVQTRFSLLDQQPGRNLIARAQGSSTAIIAYDPSASGGLENMPSSPTGSNPNDRFKQTEFESRARARGILVSALRQFGGDVGAWAVCFALASPVVAASLPIVVSYARLLELADISESADLPREFVERAFEVYDSEIGRR